MSIWSEGTVKRLALVADRDLQPDPWVSEPNLKTWVDSATGLRCTLRRSKACGHLIGYVEVPSSHPLYGLRLHHQRVKDLIGPSCHGGITVAKPAGPAGGWLFGFDGAHPGDLIPRIGVREPGDVYRRWGYMKGQVERLAEALMAASGPTPA